MYSICIMHAWCSLLFSFSTYFSWEKLEITYLTFSEQNGIYNLKLYFPRSVQVHNFLQCSTYYVYWYVFLIFQNIFYHFPWNIQAIVLFSCPLQSMLLIKRENKYARMEKQCKGKMNLMKLRKITWEKTLWEINI